VFCTKYRTAFGHCAIVYGLAGKQPRIVRIFLPENEGAIQRKLAERFPSLTNKRHSLIEELIRRIQDYFGGAKIGFRMSLLDTSLCKAPPLRVLKIERTIPYGKTASYAWIAKQIYGTRRKGCQAVGQALAKNPFPIVIPCHRAIRSNREVGDFQGGEALKRKMLALEGVEFDSKGRVVPEDFLDFLESRRVKK
jgi:methylated-DNA-[protein]-cysteine S-methyltransferase